MRNQRFVTIVLACMIPLWGWAIARQLSSGEALLSSPDSQAKAAVLKPVKTLALNPTIKHSQANLGIGYLFNSERFVKTTGGTAETTDRNNQTINMETLQYDGSIIVGETRRALISFGVSQTVTPVKRSTKAPKPRGKASRRKRSSKVITLEDNIAGYTLTAIEPLQLIFSRGSDEVVKELFSTEKQRKAVARVKTRKPTPGKARTAVKKTRPKTSKVRTATKSSRPKPPPPPPRIGQ